MLVEPIGLGGVLVDAVRERLGHDRGEVAVAGRPARRRRPRNARSVCRVVADRVVVVVARAQPAVARAAVELDPPALEGVIGVGVAAALKIRGQAKGGNETR